MVIVAVWWGILSVTAPLSAWGQAGRGPLAWTPSPAAERLLSQIVSDWQQADFDRVLSGLVRLERDHRQTLLTVVPGRVLRGDLIIDLLMAQLPMDTREKLERQPGFPPERTRRLADGPARMAEGDRHWKLGELATARTLWQTLAPEMPPTARSPRWRFPAPAPELEPQALARLCVADLLHGRLRSARRRQRLLADRFPQATGHFAGKQGSYASILDELLNEADRWPADRFLLPEDHIWLPFEEVRVDLVQLDWSVPLTGTRSADEGAWGRPQRSPGSLPTVWNEVVLLQDTAGVRGLSLVTGQSAWPVDEDDPGLLLTDHDRQAAVSPVETPRGTGLRQGVIVGSSWIGRFGPDWISPGNVRRLPSDSRIVSLDLLAEGRLTWSRSATEFSGSSQPGPWIFSGEPVIADGRLYVPLRGAGTGDVLLVACLATDSGETLWTSSVGTLLTSLGDSPVRGGDPLLLQGNTLCWNLEGRAVICLDRETGDLRWMTTLPQLTSVTPDRIVNEMHAEPGRLYALSPGAVSALDPVSGAVDWNCWLHSTEQLPHPSIGRGSDVESLLGVCDDILIISANRLRGIDRSTGMVRWSHSGTSQRGHGRALLLGRSIFWSTRDELWTVDALTGSIRQRDFLRALTGIDGGNLLLVHDRLLIAGSDALASFTILTSPAASAAASR